MNREEGPLGRCRLPASPVVSGWELHFGEEACLVGKGGSGAVFFTGCNLFCVFCQTWEISREGRGQAVSPEKLAQIFLELQDQGGVNLNLVTPTPQVVAILEALEIALKQGFDRPIVYNTGGYEKVETLKVLEGVVDIYLPDFKVWDPEVAERLLGARDYPEVTQAALKEMYRQVGDLEFDSQGLARKGLLVRHLVLPEGLSGVKEVLTFLKKELSPKIRVNLMGHYHPVGEASRHPPLDRPLTRKEWQKALEEAQKVGIFNLDRTHWPLLPLVLLDNSNRK